MKAKSSKTLSKAEQAKRATATTRERIEQDIAAFEKAGGKIEKLGNTPVFKKIG